MKKKIHKDFFFHKNILIFHKNGSQKIKPGSTPAYIYAMHMHTYQLPREQI